MINKLMFKKIDNRRIGRKPWAATKIQRSIPWAGNLMAIKAKKKLDTLFIELSEATMIESPLPLIPPTIECECKKCKQAKENDGAIWCSFCLETKIDGMCRGMEDLVVRLLETESKYGRDNFFYDIKSKKYDLYSFLMVLRMEDTIKATEKIFNQIEKEIKKIVSFKC